MDYFFRSILSTEILMLLSLLAFFATFAFLLMRIRAEKIRLVPLFSILIAGLTLRLFWIALTQPLPHSDFAVYWDYAQRFYEGNYTFDIIERHPGIILLYTFALMLLKPVMTVLYAGWTFNLAVSAIFLLTLFKLTQELFDEKTAWLALLLGVTLPQLIAYNALMASEMPAIAYLCMALWLTLQIRKGNVPNMLGWPGLSLVLSGAVLLRSTTLLLILLMPVAILIIRAPRWKSALGGTSAMVACTGLCLSTWIYHQQLITGIPKLFFGEELWTAFASQYQHGGSVTALSDLPYYARYQSVLDGTVAGKIRSYHILGEESWRLISQDPLKYLLFGFTRLRGILWSAQSGILWSTNHSPVWPFSQKVVRNLTEISTVFWRFLLISLFTLTSRLIEPKTLPNPLSPEVRELRLLIMLFIAFWLGFHFLLSVASERYAFQLIPFVLMFSAWGVTGMLSFLQPLIFKRN